MGFQSPALPVPELEAIRRISRGRVLRRRIHRRGRPGFEAKYASSAFWVGAISYQINSEITLRVLEQHRGVGLQGLAH